jgi:hypothetical protein
MVVVKSFDHREIRVIDKAPAKKLTRHAQRTADPRFPDTDRLSD